MANKKYKKSKKPKYTAAEKRAYWLGVGFHSGAEAGLGMRSDRLTSLMNAKEKSSFVNGRMIADDLSEKFVPEYVVKSAPKHSRKKNKATNAASKYADKGRPQDDPNGGWYF